MTAFPASEVTCRCCSAVSAKATAYLGLCDWCYARFHRTMRSKGDEMPTANKLNEFLARELFMQTRRMKIWGVIGRCEAMSGGDSVLIDQGYTEHGKNQCRKFATAMRDGRRVCGKHSEKECRRVVWAGAARERPYEQFANNLIEIGRSDARFRRCIADAQMALTSTQRQNGE